MRVKLIATTQIVGHIPGYDPHKGGFVTGAVGYVTDADELVEEAGRLCYESWNRPNPKTATNEGYVANILDKQHFSVMEHASATFYIDGVTRNWSHEKIRHRHFSYSEVSQRYCDVGSFAFIEHPGLVGIDQATREDLLAAIAAGRKAYKSLMKDLTGKGKERKLARQAARHALLSGTETKMLVTGNMRAWRDMLWKRLAEGADEEFRQLARLVLVELKKIAPSTFQDFEVPSGWAPGEFEELWNASTPDRKETE